MAPGLAKLGWKVVSEKLMGLKKEEGQGGDLGGRRNMQVVRDYQAPDQSAVIQEARPWDSRLCGERGDKDRRTVDLVVSRRVSVTGMIEAPLLLRRWQSPFWREPWILARIELAGWKERLGSCPSPTPSRDDNSQQKCCLALKAEDGHADL